MVSKLVEDMSLQNENFDNVQVTNSLGAGLNDTPAIGTLDGPILYARTLRPESAEHFLDGELNLSNSLNELILSNDDDVIVVLKKAQVVSAEKWATEGIGADTLQELQAKGFDIDHVYQNGVDGNKVRWILEARMDGTYSIVKRANSEEIQGSKLDAFAETLAKSIPITKKV